MAIPPDAVQSRSRDERHDSFSNQTQTRQQKKIPAPPFELPPWQCSNETRLLLVQRQRHAALSSKHALLPTLSFSIASELVVLRVGGMVGMGVGVGVGDAELNFEEAAKASRSKPGAWIPRFEVRLRCTVQRRGIRFPNQVRTSSWSASHQRNHAPPVCNTWGVR